MSHPASAQDVTDRGLAEEALERYRLLSESARDIVLFIRPNGQIADANAAAVAAYGYAREELLARTIFDLRAPDTASLIPEQLLQADSAGVRFETVHRRKDGSTFPVEVSSRGAGAGDGGGRLLLSIIRDITDRKRAEAALRDSEERFRDLFENANDVIYILDMAGRITDVNRRAEQLLGYSRAEVVGRHAAELIPPEHHPAMNEALRRKLEGEQSPTVYELEVVCKDGRRLPVEISSRLILRDGRPVGVQGIARDITERKRAEQALRDADKRKDEFLAMLAHELRNPLAPIRNAIQLLKLIGPTNPRLIQARDMIDRQATHMARLVDDLLDVSRITRGKVLLRKQRLDLVPLVRAAAEDHRPLLEGAGLKLAVELPDGPLLVEGDPTRLSQVVGNLLHNAAKFTDSGGEVVVRLTAEADGGAALSVRDTGIGMEAGMLGRLFEPFSQADRSLDRSRGGLGLGLALVKGLAELHGGAVRASSPGLGKGAEFVVRLPPAHGPARPEKVFSSASAAPTVLRVLVIEDHRDAADSLRLLLEHAGHRVAVAHAGAAGLEAARDFRPDVVLCDIGLPGGMDGYAVARALRSDPALAGSTLIALSGYGQEEDRRKARAAGFDRHLTKPVDPTALMRLLQELPVGGRV